MRDSALYYDNPTIEDERNIKRKLQKRYDGLFEAQWNPRLRSRRDLLTWSCLEKNKAMEAKSAPETNLDDCENYSQLLQRYGPNVEHLKDKIGYLRGILE